MTRWRTAAAFVIAASLAAVIAVWIPAPSAAAGPSVGYTIVRCQLHTIDLDTGALTDLPAGESSPACVHDLAVGPDGTVWGVRYLTLAGVSESPPDFLIEFDQQGVATAHLVTVEGDPEAVLTRGVAVAPDGSIFLLLAPTTDAAGCEASSACLYRYDRSTSVASLVGTSSDATLPTISQLTWCADGLRSKAGGDLLHGGTIVDIDPTTGEATPLVELDMLPTPVGYACASDADVVYALTQPITSTLFWQAVTIGTVDVATGAYTPSAVVSETTLVATGLAIGPAPPSPPSTPTTTAVEAPSTPAVAAVAGPTFTG